MSFYNFALRKQVEKEREEDALAKPIEALADTIQEDYIVDIKKTETRDRSENLPPKIKETIRAGDQIKYTDVDGKVYKVTVLAVSQSVRNLSNTLIY